MKCARRLLVSEVGPDVRVDADRAGIVRIERHHTIRRRRRIQVHVDVRQATVGGLPAAIFCVHGSARRALTHLAVLISINSYNSIYITVKYNACTQPHPVSADRTREKKKKRIFL